MNRTTKRDDYSQPTLTETPWVIAKEFLDTKTGILIRVNSRELPPKFDGAVPLTQFSWELLRRREDDGKPLRHFPARCRVEDGAVTIEEFNIGVFVTLMAQVSNWVVGERKRREDEIVARRGGR